MHMNTQPHIQIQGGQQVQPNFAMPLNVQYKYGYSNQPHPINYTLFSNNNQQQSGQVKQGLQMMPLVQQHIQAGYPQQQQLQQTKYNIVIAPQQQQQGQLQQSGQQVQGGQQQQGGQQVQQSQKQNM